MNLRAHLSPMIDVPTPVQSHEAVLRMRQMFARTLSSWAVDVLTLRQTGDGELVWHDHGAQQHWKKAA